MPRITKDEYYLNIALSVSKRSTCLKRRYGCIIVKNDEVISTGYNGSNIRFTAPHNNFLDTALVYSLSFTPA